MGLVTRRNFLGAVTAMGASLGLTPAMLADLARIMRDGTKPVVLWLQGQSCSGCSVSLLNSIHLATIDALLKNTIDLRYHPTVMAAAGDLAVSATGAEQLVPGYVLVIEGAIPTGEDGAYCGIWADMTMLQAVNRFAADASYILAVGTCAAYGGIPRGTPNPTGAMGVQAVLGAQPKLVNIPGCPAHPDWVVGTIAHILANGAAPQLDQQKRPVMYFGTTVHERCERRAEFCGERPEAERLGQPGCLVQLGCRGPQTRADCPMRKWNGGRAGRFGVNWCVGAGAPCQGCTEPGFPDQMSPFHRGEGD